MLRCLSEPPCDRPVGSCWDKQVLQCLISTLISCGRVEEDRVWISSVIGVNVGVCDSRPRRNNSCENKLKTLWRWLTLSMALSRSPTFPSWSLQRIISRRPGRISALLMPTSAPVTGRTIPPMPEVAGNATCWWVERGKKKGWKLSEGDERERTD